MPVTRLVLIFCLSLGRCIGNTISKPNFLLILVDDLRPSLGCYGDQLAHTPNIDNLAMQGIVFTEAFAQMALCAPSRNSLLTSRRPDTIQLYDFYSYWRDVVGNYTTLPQHLKNNGYNTKSIGKIFHPGISSNYTDDNPYSWTEPAFHPYTNRFKNAPVCPSTSKSKSDKNLICPVRVTSMPNKTLPDLEILKEAKTYLIQQKEQPFFLAVGFEKPHIPLKYPKKYLKYHPLKKFDVPHPYTWPDNLNQVIYNPWIDLRKREDVRKLDLEFPWEKIPVEFGKSIIQSYYAAVSYVDDLIGQLIAQLDSSNLSNNTVIVLTSDHGWSLGEHGEWSKYSNFNVAVRVPLIIVLPKFSNNNVKNLTNDHLVELVDIYPTIAELASIPIPICNNSIQDSNTCTEGTSLLPIFQTKILWKKAVFGQYPRPNVRPTLNPNSDEPRLNQINIMGYTMKTINYRYTAWIEFSHSNKIPNWDKIIAEELYDHNFDKVENNNLADDTNSNDLKLELRESLKLGWRYALPSNERN